MSELVSERDDRARVRDVGSQLWPVLHGNPQRLTNDFALTLDTGPQQGIAGVIGERLAAGELDQ